MKSIVWRMTLKLKRKPYWFQIVTFYISSFLIVLCILPLLFLAYKPSESTNGPDDSSWILVIVLAPILETLLIQYLPFWLMQKWSWTRNKYGLYILTSAIVFGLGHTYSLRYMIFAFSLGLILGYTYFFYSKTPKTAFWSTTLIHSLRNGFAFFLAAMADKVNF
jgi:hypothetical protein